MVRLVEHLCMPKSLLWLCSQPDQKGYFWPASSCKLWCLIWSGWEHAENSLLTVFFSWPRSQSTSIIGGRVSIMSDYSPRWVQLNSLECLMEKDALDAKMLVSNIRLNQGNYTAKSNPAGISMHRSYRPRLTLNGEKGGGGDCKLLFSFASIFSWNSITKWHLFLVGNSSTKFAKATE